MHSDPLDDLFANIAPDSPLAEEMEALLVDGLAVDPAVLDAATDAVIGRGRPRKPSWFAWGGVGLLAAATLGMVTWNLELRQSDPPSEDAGLAPHATVADAADEPPVSVEQVEAVAAALGEGDFGVGLLLFNQLLERGDLSEKQLRRLTISMHNAAKKADPEQQILMMEQTVGGYEAWIASFPESPRAADMNYAFAELLYKTQRYDEAFDHFMTVATKHPDSKHASVCAQSAVFTAENIIRLKEADGSWDGSEAPGLNRSETQLVAAIDAAVAAQPDGPTARDLQYKGAYTLYQSGEHADARERFEAVIDLDPASPTAVQAANLIADSFATSEDWAALEATALRFYEDDQLGDDAFEASMFNIAGRAAMKQLMDAALSSDEAADEWLGLLEQYGDINGARDLTVDALRAAGRESEADELGD